MRSAKSRTSWGIFVALILTHGVGWATPPQNSNSATAGTEPTAVPRLITFSGVVNQPNGTPVTGTVNLTFSLYTFQEGGSSLWTETQAVQLDSQGHYTVLLGSTNSNGLPLDLFTSGQAQWLGVQPELPGAAEQPRVLLVGMPYALKAVDADTLGGLPASAFAMAPVAAVGTNSATPAGTQAQIANASGAAVPELSTITGSGTANTLAMFTGSSTIGNSLITQSGGAAVIAEALQVPALGTATSSTGFNSQPFDSLASAYNSSTKAAVEQHFRWQAEPVSNDTSSPSGKFNLLFASGTGSPAETGLSLSNKGIFTFASGQTFPGTGSGTVTSVGSGAGLTGGPITKTGTLSIATAGVTNSMLQHSSLTVAAGTGLTGGGGVSLGGSTTVSVATAGITNSLLQHPSLTVTAGSGLSGGGSVSLGSSVTLSNAGVLSVGVASGLTTTGGQTPILGINTAVVPELALSNLFSVPQFIDGYLDLTPAGDSVALYGFNTSTDSSHPTLYLSNSDKTFAGDLVLDALGPNFGGECSVDVSGNLFCTGTLGATFKTTDNRQVGLYSAQSTENWIEDFGSNALTNGAVTVNLRADFAELISADADYRVFLTPMADCEGLYVNNKTATSFEVRELRSGRSNVQFDYRIVAHRRGSEAGRLPDLTARFQTKPKMPSKP